jgi:hypothetical protein
MNNELMMKYGLRNITRMTAPSFDIASRYVERWSTVWKTTSNRLIQGFQPLTGVKTLLGGAKRSRGKARLTPTRRLPLQRTSAGTHGLQIRASDEHFFIGLTRFAGLTRFTGLSIMRRLEKNPKDFLIRVIRNKWKLKIKNSCYSCNSWIKKEKRG